MKRSKLRYWNSRYCISNIGCVLICIVFVSAANSAVKVWEEKQTIPTYEIGDPEPNPMFYTNESYQGAQKRIYPYPSQDDLTRNKIDKSYTVLNLENEYVKLSILPEIGGRLFSAVDKVNDYDFFYRQHVIKPALIGMLGAWISGGIEWCVFHHHRNTTFMPVDYTFEESADGSKTIWFGETERRHRMKWIIGLTLHPGKSYIEATVKMFNRTAQPHSILYWANVAVHVNDDYQVIFPPSVQVATYHSKIDFTHWPISQGRYRGSDYTGVDISWWKNSESSNSFFAWDLQEDFMGGYDHGKKAGVVHVGNHHIVCGAKLWEWGTGTFGRRWDEILTDEDGPYAELMVGAYSDNQPDYSWIKPHEVKAFKQYWYPVRDIGGFKNANLNGAVNLECDENRVKFGFQVTLNTQNAKVVLQHKDTILYEEEINIDPADSFVKEVPISGETKATDLKVSLISADGLELISYQPKEIEPVEDLPEEVRPPAEPDEIETIEELYLTGLRVEQIHNPSVDPTIYYKEALRRDPGDSRSNTIMGIHSIKRGMYEDAETHLKTAIERISADYTRPINTEAYYQLGIAQRAQGKLDEAYDNFYRATWDNAFHSAAYYQLAELSCQKGNYEDALEQINHALKTNTLDTKALNVKAAILRKLGKLKQSLRIAQRVVKIDSLDFLGYNELILAARELKQSQKVNKVSKKLQTVMRGEVQSYLSLAMDYMNCGLWEEATDVLTRPIEAQMEFASTYPLVHYYVGYAYEQKGDRHAAENYYKQAAAMPSDFCFPFRLETREILNAALQVNPSDSHAYYYLGNLLFELQPEKAVELWEISRTMNDRFATVHRNLGWAYYRNENDIPKAVASYEKAVACDTNDPRLFYELDVLYELGNAAPARRLALLEKNHDVVRRQKESFVREIAVLVLNGKYDQAIDYLANNYFQAREGGGEIHDIYVDAHLLKGIECMQNKANEQALHHFQKASEYPENLSVGRPRFDRRAAQVAYFTGLAYEALENMDKAIECYRQEVDQSGSRRRWGGDIYQGLCYLKLGQSGDADPIFDRLIDRAQRRLDGDFSTDYFAKFGEQQTEQAQKAEAHYELGLGLFGKKQYEEAKQEFEQALQMNQSLVWAKHYLSEL